MRDFHNSVWRNLKRIDESTLAVECVTFVGKYTVIKHSHKSFQLRKFLVRSNDDGVVVPFQTGMK